ncbi:MAG: phosphoribosylaminoimidazolesuccinocarboxamide synthase [Patescibacteria group bacterium]
MSVRLIEGLPHLYRGKGKDLYDIPGRPDSILQVCRNTLSTHNVVHATEVEGKGALITALTLFMHFSVLDGIPNHIEEFGRDIYLVLPEGDYEPDLHHRALVVKRARTPDTEFIFRSHLAGSLARALKEEGTDPYNLGLSRHLPLMFRFPQPLFTPTEKSKDDRPLPASVVCERYPIETSLALKAFRQAQQYLYRRGLALIDAKFELVDGMLIDDWLNGDCSRIARLSDIHEGEEPPFLDKEIFRQIAIRNWNGGKKVPLTFTDREIKQGLGGYHEAFSLITGMTLREFQKFYLDV